MQRRAKSGASDEMIEHDQTSWSGAAVTNNRKKRSRGSNVIAAASLIALTVSLISTPSFAGPSTSILTVADFNQDGVTDLLAEKLGAPNVGLLWVIPIDSATGLRLTGASEFPIQLQDGYEFLAVGNFNGNLEGQSQIAARKTSGTPGAEIGAVRLWDLNDDASGLTTAPEGVLTIAPDPIYSLVGIGDMDDNGVDDFVFVQTDCGIPANCPNPGLIRVYLMNTSMQLMQIAHPLNAEAPTFANPLVIFGVADANGDGHSDVVLANRTQRNLRTFLMQEDATFGISVLEQKFAFKLPANDNDFLGFALLDPGARADLIFANNSGSEGLVQARLMQANAEGLSLPYYLTNMETTREYVGNGLFDSDTETDLVVQTIANGQVRVILLEMDADDSGVVDTSDRGLDLTKSSTYPVRLDPADWESRTTGAVTFP